MNVAGVADDVGGAADAGIIMDDAGVAGAAGDGVTAGLTDVTALVAAGVDVVAVAAGLLGAD